MGLRRSLHGLQILKGQHSILFHLPRNSGHENFLRYVLIDDYDYDQDRLLENFQPI